MAPAPLLTRAFLLVVTVGLAVAPAARADAAVVAKPAAAGSRVSLLQDAGLLHAAQGRDEAARKCWLKALNLLLRLQLQDAEGEFPEFVPTIDLLRGQLGDAPLPLTTLAALWRYHEGLGAFARAEDALFALLESQPGNEDLLVEARAFYQRLLRLGDATLAEGNLPRAEVAAALAALPAASR